MTANAMQGEKEKCLDAGMDDYITKPIMLKGLEDSLRLWVNRGDGTPSGEPVRADPPAGSPASPDPGIDWKRLEHLQDLSRKRDPSMFTELIRGFLEDAPARIARMKEALGRGDPEALFQAAHSLKGLSGNLGIMTMVELCDSLQAMGQAGTLAGADGFVDRLEEESRRISLELGKTFL